jgi:hypothetical protein
LPDRTAQRLIERPSALADAKWIAEQRLPQSFKSLKTPLRLSDADIKLGKRIALGIPSANSPSAPRLKLDGATMKSTPAIRHTSQRPKHSPGCCRRSCWSGE